MNYQKLFVEVSIIIALMGSFFMPDENPPPQVSATEGKIDFMKPQ